jgi:hypothetical protein
MITIEVKNHLVNVAVLGQFTLADFKELEDAIMYKIKFEGRVNVLIDLRDMVKLTVDTVWEEIKFAREHRFELWKIAVVTDSQWVAWSAWLTGRFTRAETQVFGDYNLASDWVAAAE